MNNFSEIKQLLIPKHIPFAEKKRFGIKSDGGYVLYAPNLKNNHKLISLGSNNVSSFEADVLLHHPSIEIDIYDIGGACDFANNKSNVKFYHKKITSLHDMDISEPTLIQMDIEGSEFDVFSEPFLEQHQLNITQIVVEIHFGFIQNTKIDPTILLSRLNDTFDLIHIHGNNHGAANFIGSIPETIECTYINKNLGLDLKPETSPFPIAGLDYSNCHYKKDYILDWWIDR